MKIAVIGGGISGLSAAYYLMKKGHELWLFEKESRFGGTIITERAEGFLIEGGPDCFLREKEWGVKLVKELGMESELIGTNENSKATYVLWRGKLHEIPEGFFLLLPTKIFPFLKSSLFSPAGKLRAGLEIFIPPRRDEVEESLSDFVIRRFGREVLEKIAEPLVAGVHAGDPQKMSLKATFPGFVEIEKSYGSLMRWAMKRKSSKWVSPFVTLKEGLGSLIDKLVDAMKGKVVFLKEKPVDRLRKINLKWEVFYRGGSDVFDRVVLATPSFISGFIMREFPVSKLLNEIPYVSTATISMGFYERDIEIPDGYGFVVPAIELKRITAVTFCSNKFLGRAKEGFKLIRCFVGGYRNQELVGLPDEKMIRMCLEEMAPVIKIRNQPLVTRIFRWIKGMPQYHLGHISLVEEIEKGLPEGIYLTGNAFYGIGIPDCVKRGMEIAEKIS
jgi:oxygen-dependent protoporphyrinogen oxidase